MNPIPRLQRELNELKNDPPFMCSAGLINNKDFFNWQVTIAAPEDSPYCGGLFLVDVSFPTSYPIEPPEIWFQTPIFHPNIHPEEGNVAPGFLKRVWTPRLTINKFLLLLIALLNNPHPYYPLNRDAADLYNNNIREYDNTVRQRTATFSL